MSAVNDKFSDYEKLKFFIKTTAGCTINENTIFFKDLKLIGLDAEIFIKKFSDEYTIDMSKFIFDDYFLDDFTFSIYLFRKNKPKLKEFNLIHLEKIIKKKEWFDP